MHPARAATRQTAANSRPILSVGFCVVRMGAGGSIAARASQGRHILWTRFNVFPEKPNHWLPSFALAFCLPLAVAQLGQADGKQQGLMKIIMVKVAERIAELSK